jgi:integrase
MATLKILPNGKYQVRFRDLNRKQRAKNFQLKADAKRFMVNLEKDLQDGDWIDPDLSKQNLETLWPLFIELKGGKSRSTIYDYTSMWKVHISPKWGKTKFSQLRQSTIDSWVISLGLSERREDKIHLLLCMLLDLARKENHIKFNPLRTHKGTRDKSNLRKVSKDQVGKALTQEQLHKVAQNAGYYEDHILVMGLCGARWGELVALKVSDINFNTGKLSITKTMEEIDGHLYEKDSTKTNESREVEVIDFLMKRAPKWVEGKLPSDPLFTTPEGTTLRRSNFGRRVFHPALEKAEVPKMRVHDLRWTFVTLCSALGIKQNVIRKMTGHTTDYMTAAYTKVFKEDISKEMEKLNTSAYEVHAMCTDEVKSETLMPAESEIHAQNEESLVVKALQEWLGQQDYEFGALTN